MRYSSRLFLYAPLFALLALAVAAGLQWRAVADGLETWLRRSNGHEIAPGVTLHFASESVSGFPFNVDAVLGNVTFEIRSAHTSGSWHMDGFAIHELTYGRALQIYEAAGTQTIFWTDAEGGLHRFTFVPGSLRASAILARGRLVRFDLDLNSIRAREVSGTRVQLHFRKAPNRDAIDIVASADRLHLAPALDAGFGVELRRASVAASLVPAQPFAALFAGRDSWDQALEAWRRSDGAFRLDDLEMAWISDQLHARGRLGLDGDHRPQGSFALDVDGAVKAPAAGTPDDRLARAIVQLTKVTTNAPRTFSVNIFSGAVNLRVTNAPQIAMDAGLLGPLY
jgi:hypothetical protein